MEKLLDIDRRWIWLVMFIIIGAIIINPIGLPIAINPASQNFYDTVKSLPKGSIVLIGASMAPSVLGELGPMIRSFAHQAFKQGLRIAIFDAGWNQGPTLVGELVQKEADKQGKKYGVDWINLGFKPGQQATLGLAMQDIMKATKGVDNSGQDLTQFPIMKDLPRFDKEHIAAVFALDEGSPGATDFWLPYLTQKINVPLLVGEITMSIPELKPYVASGQVKAYLGGSRGAAEYEALTNYKGDATKSQDGQSLAALYVTLLIVLANIAYLSTRNKRAA